MLIATLIRLSPALGLACVIAFPASASTAGRFEATLDERVYDLDVACDLFRENRVMFRSDEPHYASARDTDGDGFAVTGQPGLGNELTLALEIFDNGERFIVNDSIPGQALELSLSGSTLTGIGEVLGGDLSDRTIEFTVTCP